MNRQYLEALRSGSCYPTFRGFITVFELLGYLIAALVAAGGFISGQSGAMLLGVVGAVLIVLLIRVAKEMSLMLADIADATIDASSKSAAPHSAIPVESSQVVAAPPEDDESAMARYGIAFDGEKYQFKSFRYDRLSDAINYAKRHSGQS
ncbi:hypothetical protein WCE55_02470 [Luteimonas sp. MJ293]|uniref:hypothetical protein n=1 Tax=Luteimonas sp. MJ146 TaxID=3129240 RepID=UPI0031BB29DF